MPDFPNLIANLLIDGAALGAALFLVAAGLCFRIGPGKGLNLAQGIFPVLGAAFYMELDARLGLFYPSTLMLSLISVIVVALVVERLVYRPLEGAALWVRAFVTLALAAAVSVLAALWHGPGLIDLPNPPGGNGRIGLAGVSLSERSLLLVGVAAALLAVLRQAIRTTSTGIAYRALADAPQTASALGIRPGRTQAFFFALSAGLAATGGILGYQVLALSHDFALRALPILLVIGLGAAGSLAQGFVIAMMLGLAMSVFPEASAPSHAPALTLAIILVLALLSLSHRASAAK